MSVVAAIQMASGPNVKANLEEAEKLIKTAVQQDAELVVLPENFAIMGLSEVDKVTVAEPFGEGQIQQFLSQQASKLGIWIVLSRPVSPVKFTVRACYITIVVK